MIDQIYKSIVTDLLEKTYSQNYFNLNIDAKRELFKDYPLDLLQYAISVSESDFYTDMRLFITGDLPSIFVNYYIKFIKEDFSLKVSSLDSYHFSKLTSTFSNSTVLAKTLNNIISKNTKKDLHRLLVLSLRKLNTNIVKVTLPKELKEEEKSAIRKNLQNSFVAFKKDKSIIGGIKVLDHATLYDYSFSNLFNVKQI